MIYLNHIIVKWEYMKLNEWYLNFSYILEKPPVKIYFFIFFLTFKNLYSTPSKIKKCSLWASSLEFCPSSLIHLLFPRLCGKFKFPVHTKPSLFSNTSLSPTSPHRRRMERLRSCRRRRGSTRTKRSRSWGQERCKERRREGCRWEKRRIVKNFGYIFKTNIL